jgi:uncharacterized protein (TIGR02588 family)
MSDQQQNGKQERERKTRSTAEMIVLIAASLLVLFLIGYSIYHGIVAAGEIPRLQAIPHFERLQFKEEYYWLPITVHNLTRPTVADVTVMVENTGTGEQREFTINYLPEYGHLEGVVAFRARPTPDAVTARIESFRLP